MTTKNYYEDVSHIVYITSNVSKGCEICAFPIGGDKFAESINHYIEKHGYKLLHAGSETIPDMMGNPFHVTVALVGK